MKTYYIYIILLLFIFQSYLLGIKTQKFTLRPNFLENGEFNNTLVSTLGHLKLSFEKEIITSIKRPLVFNLYKDNKYLIATSFSENEEKGEIYFFNSKDYSLEKTIVIEDSVATAISADKSSYYVGSLMQGAIYKISKKDISNIKRIAVIENNYVWDILVEKNRLYVASGGEKGKLFEVSLSSNNEVKLLGTFEEPNITKVKKYKNNLYISSSKKGKLYKFSLNSQRKKVLYDSINKDIADFVFVGNGKILLATSNENDQNSSQSSQENGNNQSSYFNGKRNYHNISLMNINKINLDNEHEGSAPSSNGNNGDMSVNESNELPADSNLNLLVLINEKEESSIISEFNYSFGRIFYNKQEDKVILHLIEDGQFLSIDMKTRQITEIQRFKDQKVTTSFFSNDEDIYGIIAGKNEIVKISTKKYFDKGYYSSEVFDLQETVNWGKLSFENYSNNKKIKAFIRTGRTNKPDEENWGDWQAVDFNQQIKNSASRFIQIGIELHSSGLKKDASPMIKDISFYYSLQNRAPYISNFFITYNPTKEVPFSPDEILFPELREYINNLAKVNGMNKINLNLPIHLLNKNKKLAVWFTDNPEKDIIEYNIFYRLVSSEKWVPLFENQVTPFFIIDNKNFADGIYEFKIEYNDFLSNGENNGFQQTYISSRYTIDNSPPIFENVRRIDNKILFSLKDSESIIESVEYSSDQKKYYFVSPIDLVYDSKEEAFSIKVTNDSAILLIGKDEYNNKVLHWVK